MFYFVPRDSSASRSTIWEKIFFFPSIMAKQNLTSEKIPQLQCQPANGFMRKSIGQRSHGLSTIGVVRVTFTFWIVLEHHKKWLKAWKRRGFKASAYDIKLSTDTMDIVTESGFYNLLLLCLRLFLSLKVAFPPAAIPLRIVNPWRVHGCRSGSLCVSQMYMQQVHL